ncbi:probable ATP-dependent DNA helicase CHR719 [Miscanthus floridulus]|uniref:probable ATP-dependent DNA helicase CHR719 n=1 Tax=Miscanthus floridulus TaxID=154761 RepID=UPI00345A36F6
MAASVDAAAAVAPPTAVEEAGGAVEQARTLIGALNLLSRNLPLPPDVLRVVSSIYHDGGAGDEEEEEEGEEREAEKEGDKEMAASDGIAEAKEDPADGATTKVRAGGSSCLCGDFPPSVRVLPGLCVGLVSGCWGPACYGLWNST